MNHKDTGRRAPTVLSASRFVLMLAVALLAGRSLGDERQVGHAERQPGERGTLEVTVTGFESEAGLLAIALFANADDYATQTNAIRRAWLAIDDGQSHWVVEDLPEGDYALIAYQDLNGNEQIDMRIFGMPKEPVGVSNDARGIFGPPRFKAASFRVAAPLTTHRFTLR